MERLIDFRYGSPNYVTCVGLCTCETLHICTAISQCEKAFYRVHV